MKQDHNYWLVGADWSGSDQADAFFRRGYWEIGYSDEQQPRFAAMRDEMRSGDRVAVKAMRGRGAQTITVKALGIVKEVHDKQGLHRLAPHRPRPGGRKQGVFQDDPRAVRCEQRAGVGEGGVQHLIRRAG